MPSHLTGVGDSGQVIDLEQFRPWFHHDLLLIVEIV
jgi:hypothetical protein